MIRAFVLTLLLAISIHAADTPPTSTKPNVVFLLGDDVGWSDISYADGTTTPIWTTGKDTR